MKNKRNEIYELKENIYVGEFSNVDDEIDISEYVKCDNSKAIVKYYLDEKIVIKK